MMPKMLSHNYHCCVLRFGKLGLLIDGASGAGKTSLMLGLLERAEIEGIEAQFVCDDQALLSLEANRLIATSPTTIAGKVEIAGYGIIKVPHVSYTKIDMVVRIVPDSQMERMPKQKTTRLLERELRMIEVPERHEAQSVRIVLATYKSL